MRADAASPVVIANPKMRHCRATNRWSVLALLFAARAVMGFQFQSVASSAPSLRGELGLDPGQIGTLIGLYMLPGVAIALPGGLLVRRLGEKRTCLFGLAVMAAGGCLAASANSFSGVAMGRAVSGAGGVIFNLVLTSMVAGWFAGAGTVTAMAILLASWPSAIAAALIGETALSMRYGWSMVAHGAAALCLAAWFAVALLYTARPDKPTHDPAGNRPTWPEAVSCAFAGLLWGSFNAGLVIFYSFTPQMLVSRGWPPVEAGSATSLALWITIFSLPMGGWMVETLRCPNSGIAASCIAAAAVMAALPVIPSPMILAVTLGVAIGPGAGAIVGLPAQIVSSGGRATAFGIFYTGYYVVMAIGPGLAGWAQDYWGTVTASLLAGSLLFMSGVIMLWAATIPALLFPRRHIHVEARNSGS